MSLTRPAYRATVTNLDTGYSASVEAGDTYDPDAGVWLADGLELAWTFEDQVPCQLEPETAKFAFLADTAANLPVFDMGDRVRVSLVRPANMLLNGSFEALGLTNWSEFNGTLCDAALSTDTAFSGDQSVKVTCVTTTASSIGIALENPAGRVPISVGEKVWGSAYFKALNGARDARVQLVWYDDTNTALSTVSGTLTSVPTTGWTRLSVSGIAPANAVTVRLTAVYAGGTGGLHVGYIDAAMVTVSESLWSFSAANDPTYMEFAGRVTDSLLGIHAKTGRLLLSVIAVDPTADLSMKIYRPDFETTLAENVPEKLSELYNLAESAITGTRWSTNVATWDMSEAIEVPEYVRKTLNSCIDSTDGYPVLRYAEKGSITAAGWTESTRWGARSVWTYFVARYLHKRVGTTPALLEFAYDATDPDKVTVVAVADPATDGSVLPLDACYLPDLAELTKDRTVAPNLIELTGTLDGVNEAPPAYAIDYGAFLRFGAITREVQSMADDSQMNSVAEAFLSVSPTSSPDAWRFPETTVLTDVMDDDTLDTYAPAFWYARSPEPADMGRPIALVGLPADIDVTGGFLLTKLYGATFIVSEGKLAIELALTPTDLPLSGTTTPSPTYDAFDAAYPDAAYDNQGGTTDYIDRNISYEKAKLTKL